MAKSLGNSVNDQYCKEGNVTYIIGPLIVVVVTIATAVAPLLPLLPQHWINLRLQ